MGKRIVPPVGAWPRWVTRLSAIVLFIPITAIFFLLAFSLAVREGCEEFWAELKELLPEVAEVVRITLDVVRGKF